jgi:hypothetical protein
MLSKLPMALILRAREDEKALRELCELLRPEVEPWRPLMMEAARDAEAVERWIVEGVRHAIRSQDFASVGGESLSGIPFVHFMMNLRDATLRPAAKINHALKMSKLRGHRATGDAVLGGGGADAPSSSPLSVYVDLAKMTPEEILELLAGLSDLYRSVGGDGLAIRTVGTMEPALIPAGA